MHAHLSGHVPVIDMPRRSDGAQLKQRVALEARAQRKTGRAAPSACVRPALQRRALSAQGQLRCSPCPRPGAVKVACHFMFGILTTVGQLMRLAI